MPIFLLIMLVFISYDFHKNESVGKVGFGFFQSENIPSLKYEYSSIIYIITYYTIRGKPPDKNIIIFIIKT